MLNELKEDIENSKKMIYEQNGNVNKEIKNLKEKSKRNSGAEEYNNRNENFTRGIQRQLLAASRNNP